MNRPNQPNFNPYPPQNLYPYPVPPPRANALAAFKLALRFLTRIPVRLKPGDDTPLNRRLATVFYPLVGGVIGLCLICVLFFTYYFNLFNAGGAIAVAAWMLLTGGLHFDGLMDVFDGFFYAGPPERRLEIMKDVHHGTYAILGAIVFIFLKIRLIEYFQMSVLLFAAAYARWAALKIVQDEPVVNPNGMAARLKNELHPKAVSYGAILPGLALLWILFSDVRWSGLAYYRGFAGMGLRQGLIEVIRLILWVLRIFILIKLPGWLGKTARRYIGGINGDVLGAAIELSEVAVLMILKITPEFFISELPAVSFLSAI